MHDLFTIDIFKDKHFWKNLEQYNKELIDFSKRSVRSLKDNNYDIDKGECSDWFDLEHIKKTPVYPINPNYPNPHPAQLDPKFNLIMHSANYTTLFLVNCLFNKDIIFEDICCGISHISFYLSRLGFRKFNFIDNFSQVSKNTLLEFIELIAKPVANGVFAINSYSFPSNVSNIVAFPMYPKRFKNKEVNIEIYRYDVLEPPPDIHYIAPAIDLFCSYYPIDEKRGLSGLDKNRFFGQERFVPLCTDEHQMLHSYCRKEKYEEFKNKLKQYIISV